MSAVLKRSVLWPSVLALRQGTEDPLLAVPQTYKSKKGWEVRAQTGTLQVL